MLFLLNHGKNELDLNTHNLTNAMCIINVFSRGRRSTLNIKVRSYFYLKIGA